MAPVHAGMRLGAAGPAWRYTEGTLASSHAGPAESARSAAYLQNWKSAASPASRRSSFRVIPIDFEGATRPPTAPPVTAARFRPSPDKGHKLVGIVEPIRSETLSNPSSRLDHSNGPLCYKDNYNLPHIGSGLGLSGDNDNFTAVRTITFCDENDCPPPPPRRRMSLSGGPGNNHRVPAPSNVPFPENLDDAISCKHRLTEREPRHLAEPVSWFDSRGGATSRPLGISGDYVVIPIEYIKTSPYANIAGALGRDIRRTFNKFFVAGRHKTDDAGETLEPQESRGQFRRRNSISASSDLKYIPNHKINPPSHKSASPPHFNANRSQQPSYRPHYYNQPILNGFDKPKNEACHSSGDDFASLVSQINSLCSSDTNSSKAQDKNDKHHIRADPKPRPVQPDSSDANGTSVKQPRPPQVSSTVIPPRTGQAPLDLRLVAACADLSVSDRVRTFENRGATNTTESPTPTRALRRSASFLTTLPRRPKSILKNPPAPAPAPSTPAPKSVRFDDTVRRQFFRVNSCDIQDGDREEDGEAPATRSYIIPRPKITSSCSSVAPAP